jgi:DNA-binding transcriptional ArsR family regulator
MASPKKALTLSPQHLEEIAGLFKMLGEPMRLRILQSICQEPRSVSDIVDATESTQANVSKHLALLTAAGLLRRERDGQRVFYSVKEPLVLRLCEVVKANWID